MPISLLTLRTDVRSRLDEVTARFWQDDELNTWINEATRDLARRTETIQQFSSSLSTQQGQAKYNVPSDCIRIHRVEFIPTGNNTNVYPVEASNYQEMQQYWGISPTIQQSYPSFYVLWGMPPILTMQLYPVPSGIGTLNLYYYRLPKMAVQDNDLVEVVEGWQDCVALYCEFVAKRKNRDPTWQDAKKLYEETVTLMLDVTRQWHDQSQSIFIGNSAVPQWLYGGGEY